MIGNINNLNALLTKFSNKMNEDFIFDIISNDLFKDISIDFEFMLKHCFLSINELMKINNPKINFLMRVKNFLKEANLKLYKNYLRYSK